MPDLPGSPTFADSEDGDARRFPVRRAVLIGVVACAAVAGGLYWKFGGASKGDRPDLLLHTVKHESLNLTVVERGTLESADNKDVICRVKAGSKGNYATTIKWVIDDGTLVTRGRPIMILDSSTSSAPRISNSKKSKRT